MSKKTPKNTPRVLRSRTWFASHDRDALVHRSWMKNQGIPDDQFDGRPVIGICNTWSQATPCNAHFRELAGHVRDGILDAGGFPIEFPVMSLGETMMRPTTMLFRNQVAMDVEESIRANPFDGVVLMMGCDKTTPALLMGAASCDLPTIGISGGPMLNGKFRGEDIGSGTHVWKFTEMLKTGEMKMSDMVEVESCMSRSAGHCMTMGTASTMASMVEALGMGLPTNAAIPAVDSRRRVLARMAGRRIVEMVNEDLRMSRILTKEAFENAIMVNGAIGGSTNAVVHLLAVAGRIGVKLTLDDWDRLGRDMPCLVNLMPSGKYLMEDFYYAGGLPVVIREVGKFLHRKALTVNGRTLWENCKDAVNYNEAVITPLGKPFKPQGGIAVLRGNLAPNGCVLKPSAATPKLLKHRGRAVVFEDIDDLHKRIEELRPQGVSGVSRSRQFRAARQAIEEGRDRHDPHFGRADVRHRLWHGRAAYGARGGRRRNARAGAQWRSHRTRCREAPHSSPRVRRRTGAAPGKVEAAAAACRARLGEALLRHRAAGRSWRGPRFPGRRLGGQGRQGQSLNSMSGGAGRPMPSAHPCPITSTLV